MPRLGLPPLHFLPAFEAAGRLGSFKAAAAELHVTPSAISQQLKAVEEALGTALFERRGRAVLLTSEGATFLRDVQHALAELTSASRRLRRHAEGQVFKLSTADFIAYEFLLPRLSLFRQTFPGLELSLEATTRLIDFASSDVDAAIRIADGPFPGLVAHGVGDAWVAPVCSAALAETIHGVADLAAHPLIEVRGQERRGFRAFMQKHGVRAELQQLSFEGYLETMRAAEQGLGVAFAVFPMTTEWVTSGRLAVPLALRVPFANKISFLYRATSANDARYERFAAWLRDQYAALPALPSGRIVRATKRAAGSPRVTRGAERPAK